MTIMVHLIAIAVADMIGQIVLVCCPIPPDGGIDIVVQLITLLRQKSGQPLVLVSVLLVPEIILCQLVAMPDSIAKAVEVGDVCLGEGEAGAPSYIRTAKCIDILIVQVHQGRGTLIIELLVGEPDLVVRRILVPVDIHPNPERARELRGMKLGY